MLSVFLIVGCVTYQPKQTEAFLGKVAQYGAKKTAQWVAKESVGETIELILKKKIDITDPLFDKYLKRVDYDLVHIDGKTFLMRNNLGAAEKASIKGEIDKVLDQMIYGKNAAWLSWLDWWSIGPAILAGNIIFSEMTDENYSFIDELITTVLTNLGYITPALKKETDPTDGEAIKHYDTPPPSKTPERNNKNYSGTRTVTGGETGVTVFSGGTSVLTPTKTMTFVMEIVPNKALTSFATGSTVKPFWTTINTTEGNTVPSYLYLSGNVPYLYYATANGSTAKLYKDGTYLTTVSNGVTDVSKYVSFSDVLKYNRQIFTMDYDQTRAYPWRLTTSMTSTIATVPQFSTVVEMGGYDANDYVRTITFNTTLSQDYKDAGGVGNWDLFTDRVSTLPSPSPAPKLIGKDTIKSPVINKNPNTGKPTMAIPTTVIVQDPTKNPVKPDPEGGIIISKPDGTPVTDPETELDPVTNQPEVKPNPETGEPEIIVQPNKPPEPATPPKTEPPTTEEPDTGDPDTGDPGTETPPTDPDDNDPTKVKWDKLKKIPNFMTTRFPFSLPWDIGRFMDAVFPDVTPVSELVFEFPDIGDFDTDFEITIPEYFDPWMDFARSAFIYGFDIALVYSIYRLFGGAQ